MKNLTEAKEKRWIIKSDFSDGAGQAIKEIADELGIHPVIAKLLYNRGYHDPGAAKEFIYMESEMLSTPFDMVAADFQQ